MLTQKRLKEVLRYDSATGVFTWKIRPGYAVKKGATAGCVDDGGYISICVDKTQYYGHRLAWLYSFGYFPEKGIDHINRDQSDNSMVNLRVVSQSCNIRNTGNWSTNKSGVKGVSKRDERHKWRVRIWHGSKEVGVGEYGSLLEAACHRLAAEQCIGWDGCDSSSPAYKYVKKHLDPVGSPSDNQTTKGF